MPSYRVSFSESDIEEFESHANLFSAGLRKKLIKTRAQIKLGILMRQADHSRDELNNAGGIFKATYHQYSQIDNTDLDARLLFLKGLDNINTRGKVCEYIMQYEASGSNADHWFENTSKDLKNYVMQEMMDFQARKGPAQPKDYDL